MGYIEKRIALIHHMPLLLNLIPTNHVPIVMLVGMMKIIYSHHIWNYDKANHKPPMLVRKSLKGNNVANKRLATLPTSSQSNTMETLVMNMATHVKFDAFGLKNAKGSNQHLLKIYRCDPRYFCGARFSSLWPKTKLCHVFQKTMTMGTNCFLKQPKCFLLKH
jgi:hypothetical protein